MIGLFLLKGAPRLRSGRFVFGALPAAGKHAFADSGQRLPRKKLIAYS